MLHSGALVLSDLQPNELQIPGELWSDPISYIGLRKKERKRARRTVPRSSG